MWRVASDRTLDTRFLLGIPLLESRNSTHGSALALQGVHRLTQRYWQRNWLTIHLKNVEICRNDVGCFYFVQIPRVVSKLVEVLAMLVFLSHRPSDCID